MNQIKYIGAVKDFIEEYWGGIVLGIIVLLVAGYFISKHRSEKTEYIQKISTFAEDYNAVTDWQEMLDKHGIMIAIMMIIPPIVGVPSFSFCPCNPKSLTVSPI